MWALFLKLAPKLLPTVLGWFGIDGSSKSDAQAGMETGEKLGVAETKEAAENKELQDVQKASDARGAVDNSASSISSDPNNRG